MPKLMKPVTFGCESGFEEVFYNIDSPHESNVPGNVFCYHNRLTDEEKKDTEVIHRCRAMPSGECWKLK